MKPSAPLDEIRLQRKPEANPFLTDNGTKMTKIAYLSPSADLPLERHVAVVIHRDQTGTEKGYFYDTAAGDTKGAGPFDWNMDEAIARAKEFALEMGLSLVTVRAQLT